MAANVVRGGSSRACGQAAVEQAGEPVDQAEDQVVLVVLRVQQLAAQQRPRLVAAGVERRLEQHHWNITGR